MKLSPHRYVSSYGMVEDFERAVADHKDMVYSFAYHYLGSHQEAEDVTQDVLLRLWNHWHELDLETVGRWLNRVTRNAAYDVLRRHRVRRRHHIDDRSPSGEDLVARIASEAPDPLRTTLSADFGERIRQALALLDEPYRSAVILREVQELSYQDIAETLSVPLNTAKTHVHRGRRRLRELLDEVAGHAVTRKACG